MMHLMKYLWAQGVKFRVIGHAPRFLAPILDGTMRAPRSKVFAKTIIVRADHHYWMVVVPADCGVDWHRLCDVLRADCITRVSEDELKILIPDTSAESLCPFGQLYGFPVVVDGRLASEGEIAFNACSRTDFIVMKYRDYEQLARPLVAEIAQSLSPAEA